MSTNNINDLLRRGIEAARNDDRATARELLQQVVELDDKNEKAWFWLASVVDTLEERRVCLNNVLHINPNNEKAREAMDALESKARKKVNEEEVIPGVTRSQITLILGGGILIVVVIVVAFAAIVISNNNAVAAQNIENTRVVQAAIDANNTATQSSLAITATFEALATDTPNFTPTSGIPTLPPTWTPVPSETPIPTAAVLPPVTGLTGFLGAYSGRDVLNNGYLNVGYFNLGTGGTWTPITTEYGRHVSFSPNGQRVVYARYDQLLFSSVLTTANINGTDPQGVNTVITGTPVLEPQQPHYSENGQLITFIARGNTQNTQVFLYNVLDNTTRQLTTSDSVFTHPSISPDGTRIVAVRDDVNSPTPGADLVLIDVNSGGQVPVSNDRSAFIETMPRWLDDNTIVYSVAPATDPQNYDIFYRQANGGGSPLPLVREPGAEQYPVISPDRQHMAFASNRTGAWDIYIYNFSNQQLAQLTNTAEADYPTDWWQP
ncbi:MAG: hypothetical protein SF162_12935 [bacterium]|nr:hypothetical protein [bacterium]